MTNTKVHHGPTATGATESTRKGAASTARIIEAAIASLHRFGYGGTTVSVVVSESGTSRGAFLHHFPTKTALMLAVIRHTWTIDSYLYREWIERYPDPEDAFIHAPDAVWEAFSRPSGVASMEILVACRSDVELRNAVIPVQTAIVDAARVMMAGVVTKAGLPAEAGDSFLVFMESALRGLLIDWVTFNNTVTVEATITHIRSRAGALLSERPTQA